MSRMPHLRPELSDEINGLHIRITELEAREKRLVAALEGCPALCEYLEDFARLGGGEMKKKYGDDPMKGFDNILKRSRPLTKRARAALDAMKRDGDDG